MANRLTPSTPFETGTVRLVELGHKLPQDSTGRVWSYARAGASDLDRGKLTVSATIEANHDNLAFASAPAAGDTIVSVTLGATAAAENLYRDGWLVVQDGTGEGRAYPIEGHSAIGSGGTGDIVLREEIDTAGATGETGVDLLKNRYDGLVISPTDHADPLGGVPNVAIGDTEYGWSQTWGPCAVWHDEAVTAGAAITSGDTTGGQVETQTAGDPLVGHEGPAAGVATEYQLVNLMIDR